MKQFLSLVCCLSVFFKISFADTGDTTFIIAHTKTNLNSPPSDDDAWVLFPNNATTYQRVIMKFTLGCGTPNCSGWDYTVNALLGKKTNDIDSSVVSVDTLTHDTTWTYFNHVAFIEVGRLITPYGTYMANNISGFNRNWTHPYYYDITDYVDFLKDSVAVRVHYDGWTDAFSASIEFLLIEGPPARKVESVEEIYHTYVGYPNSAGFESVAIPKTFLLPQNVTSAKVAVFMTGHGEQGEFDPHSFHIKVNGNIAYSQLLWKDDCDINAVAPQGGTWIFHRANWCPGEKVPVYEADITPYISPGTTISLDLDFDNFIADRAAGYGVSAHFITYSSQNNNDVMLEEIIAPNSDKPYLHFNPICTNPIVKIKNMGIVPLTYAEISYWVKGGSKWYYEWRGNLAPLASETITLPAFDWNSSDSLNNTFVAEANWPNDIPDEYVYNNHLESKFNLTPKMDSVFVFYFKSNNQPWENRYVIRNEDGDIISNKNTFAANTAYRDTLQLPPGSYALDFYDYDSLNWGAGDGLSFFLNNDPRYATPSDPWYETIGQIGLRRVNNTIIKNFTPEFGHNLHYEFTVGYTLRNNLPKIAPEPPVHPTGLAAIPLSVIMNVFPNPAQDILTIKLEMNQPETGKILISDISGRILKQYDCRQETLTVSTKELTRGMYFLSFISERTRIGKKIILQ